MKRVAVIKVVFRQEHEIVDGQWRNHWIELQFNGSRRCNDVRVVKDVRIDRHLGIRRVLQTVRTGARALGTPMIFRDLVNGRLSSRLDDRRRRARGR